MKISTKLLVAACDERRAVLVSILVHHHPHQLRLRTRLPSQSGQKWLLSSHRVQIQNISDPEL